jgi:catechol 2,3-dioxygenase-like lactoylglutathione lyase family enzyme
MKRNGILFLIALIMMVTVSADVGNSKIEASHELGTRTMAHVAIVVRDIEAATEAYAALFGMDPPGIRLGKSPDYMGHPTEGKAKMAFIKLDNISLEFFQPVGGPSAWQDFLESRGEGVHHFGFWVEGLDDHVRYFETGQMPVVQRGGGDWGRYRYIDATGRLGVMIELLEKKTPGS